MADNLVTSVDDTSAPQRNYRLAPKDVTVNTLSKLFHVSSESVVLVESLSMRVILPQPDGKIDSSSLLSGETYAVQGAALSRCCALIRVIQWCTRRTPLQSKTSSHADKKATTASTGKIADVPVPKTDERTVCRQECGPSCTLQIRGDQRCMCESTETTHGVLQLSVGGRRAMWSESTLTSMQYNAPRNMRNVIDSMAEINTYSMFLPFCYSLISSRWLYSSSLVWVQIGDSEEKQSSVTLPVLITEPLRSWVHQSGSLDGGIAPFFITSCNYCCWFCIRKALWRWFTQDQEKEITFKRWPPGYQSWKLCLAPNGLKKYLPTTHDCTKVSW